MCTHTKKIGSVKKPWIPDKTRMSKMLYGMCTPFSKDKNNLIEQACTSTGMCYRKHVLSKSFTSVQASCRIWRPLPSKVKKCLFFFNKIVPPSLLKLRFCISCAQEAVHQAMSELHVTFLQFCLRMWLPFPPKFMMPLSRQHKEGKRAKHV